MGAGASAVATQQVAAQHMEKRVESLGKLVGQTKGLQRADSLRNLATHHLVKNLHKSFSQNDVFAPREPSLSGSLRSQGYGSSLENSLEGSFEWGPELSHFVESVDSKEASSPTDDLGGGHHDGGGVDVKGGVGGGGGKKNLQY